MYANTNTLETAPKTVLETYVRQVEKLVHLTINGEEIVTTDNHPFYVQGRGFINAGNLLVGDKLISVNGEDLFVEKHRVEEFDEPVDVYNFQVEDYHTYFVGESAVWVHNNNKACPVPEPRKSEKHKTADGEPLTYKSNSKHTPGQDGNCSDAGIEPRNSFELFEDSIASTEKTGHRYAYEKETDTIHRFFSNAEETEWHWCGSENQGKNSLNITKIPKDIKKHLQKSMVLNGKEDNMLIGDPYKFAVLFDRVKKWNPSLTDNNGFFALCIDGKLFPDEIENAVIPVGVRDVKVALSGIPVDEKIFDMDSKDAILILYDLVYPEFDDEKSDEENRDNDFRYLLSTNELVDDNYLVFAVGKERKIRILGTKAEYDFEEKRDVLCNSKVTEIILEKDYVNNVIAQLEEIKWN